MVRMTAQLKDDPYFSAMQRVRKRRKYALPSLPCLVPLLAPSTAHGRLCMRHSTYCYSSGQLPSCVHSLPSTCTSLVHCNTLVSRQYFSGFPFSTHALRRGPTLGADLAYAVNCKTLTPCPLSLSLLLSLCPFVFCDSVNPIVCFNLEIGPWVYHQQVDTYSSTHSNLKNTHPCQNGS